MKIGLRVIFALFGGFVLTFFLLTMTQSSSIHLLQIGESTYSVKIADTPAKRYQGLSNVAPGALGADGMLFLFPDAAPRIFEMRGMKFPLDILWIRNGVVVAMNTDVPAPGVGEAPARVSSDPLSADMVLEVPAGFAEREQVFVGTKVTYPVKN